MKECLLSDTPSSFNASPDRGALSANVITTAEVCFLSAAKDVLKEAVYLDNKIFETSLRLKNDITYDILHKCIRYTSPNRLYKKFRWKPIPRRKNVMLIRSRKRQLFMFYGPRRCF